MVIRDFPRWRAAESCIGTTGSRSIQSAVPENPTLGSNTWSRSDDPFQRYGRLKFSKMAASRHLGFGKTGSWSIRSAVPENPTIGSNARSIGRSVAEIWPFKMLTLITSLMTSQGPNQKSVKNNYFPQVGDHRVKISAQSDKKSRRRSILKNRADKQTNKQTQPQNSTLTENKGCLKL